MPTFQPKTMELIQRGATAALLLDAQKQLCGDCVEGVLRRIDHAVLNEHVTAEKALQWVAEIAAYRAIIHRQQQIVTQGKNAEYRMMEEPAGHV